MNLNKLRWKALAQNGVSYNYVKKYLNNKYNINIKEESYDKFVDVVAEKYTNLNEQEALFDLEDTSFKKVSLFSLNEKDQEELSNDILKELFISTNRMHNILDNKKLEQLDDILYPCYASFGERYVVIKVAQLRRYTISIPDENYVTTDVTNTYYHCAKFVADLQQGIVALFYNDINNEGEDGTSKGRAITEKKQLFYTLFSKGNQNTLLKLNLDDYLNKYIKEYLECLDQVEDDDSKSVVVIETADPFEHRNNLRSSKKDGRHNEYRLKAIKYALEHEDHTVKLMECYIDNRWFQFKNQGEIISNVPYFSREVIESVCKEIFPSYTVSGSEAVGEY